jgi:D-threo-aldose 1-dehydrogenase
MKPTQKRTFGRAGLEVTAMGLGTAPLGNQFRFVPDADARAVTDGAWDAGLRYFDTAPFYGNGLSELRLGDALRWRPRDEYVL